MHTARTLTAMFGAVPVAAALSAQTPASEIDTHICAAKAAAGLEYRATFVSHFTVMTECAMASKLRGGAKS